MNRIKKSINPFSTPHPWNAVAGGYARTTQHALAQYAEEALRRARLKPHFHVLDVACGPGALSLIAAKKAARVSAIDFSKDMLKLFRHEIKRKNFDTIHVHHGDGQHLPFKDNTFNAAFSMFGLMFFPDRKRGFNELYRTLKPGGTAAVSSWAPVSKSPVMKLMFESIRQMNPEMPAPQRAIRSLEDPRVFRQEMREAGFRNVRILPLVKGFPIGRSVSKFWKFMVDGSAPIVMMRKKMGPKIWKEKEKIALRYLRKALKHRPAQLTSQAWLGLGEKAGLQRLRIKSDT
jgi:ubiquinone/menaquinone biosynthesis C-methylase UbiE